MEHQHFIILFFVIVLCVVIHCSQVTIMKNNAHIAVGGGTPTRIPNHPLLESTTLPNNILF
jgi:hypothetical protein